MKLTTQLRLTFLLMTSLTLGIGWVGLARMRQLNEVTVDIALRRWQRVRLAEQGVARIDENARTSMRLFVIADAAEFDRQIVNQVTRSKELRDVYDQFEKQIDTDEERRLFMNIRSTLASYTQRRSEAESILRSGYRDESRLAFETDVTPSLKACIDAWEVLLRYEGQRMEEVVHDATRTYERSRAITLSLIGAAIALALVVSAVMARRITQPILALLEGARRVEAGGTARVVSTSRDELGELTLAFNTMADAVSYRRQHEHEALKNELALARHIQTALLPRAPAVPGLEISAEMRPFAEVGGDYYDVLPVRDGCFVGVGDVAGHGLNAGLVMLMIQSSISTLVRGEEGLTRTPKEIVSTVNQVIFENLHARLEKPGHATLVLLRLETSGHVTYAGAHEPVLLWRRVDGRTEILETPGTWIGGVPDVRSVTVDTRVVLADGDVLVLYSDGLTEARNAQGEMFGVERLGEELERKGAGSVREIREALMNAVLAWGTSVDDDLTLVVVRYQPTRPPLNGDIS